MTDHAHDDVGMSAPRKPKPVIVDDLKAVAYRAPVKRDPRWAWRCRHRGELVLCGRYTRAEVRRLLLKTAMSEPCEESEAALVGSVGQVLDLWFTNEIAGQRKPATEKTYESRALAIARLIGDLRVDRGRRVLDELHRLMALEGWTSATRNLTQAVLIMAWKWAQLRGLVSVAAPPRRKLSQGRSKPRVVPTLEQAQAAILRMSEPYRSVLTVQLATGARVGEICALEVDDILEERGRLVLTLGAHVGAEKTGRRIVPITTVDADRTLRRSMAAARLARRRRLWVNSQGRPTTTSIAGAQLRGIDWDEIGCEPFQTHALRFLAVRTARLAGVLPEAAAALFGHSVTMMLTVYREVDRGELFDAMERMRLGEGGGVVGLR